MRDESTIETYSDAAVRHFMHPLNTKQFQGVTGIGCATSDHLEDLIELSIRVSGSGAIDGVRCRTVGCVAAVACGSVFSELLLGKTLAEAAAVSAQDVLDDLGGLPRGRACCANLPILALQAALEHHREHIPVEPTRRSRAFVHRRSAGQHSVVSRPVASTMEPTFLGAAE